MRFLLDTVVEAIEDHARTYNLTEVQVLELAIAQMIDLDQTSIPDLKQLQTMAQLKEENAILRSRLQALGQSVETEAF